MPPSANHQVVVRQLQPPGAKSRAEGDRAVLKIDVSTSRMISWVRGHKRRIGETTSVRPIEPEITSGNMG